MRFTLITISFLLLFDLFSFAQPIDTLYYNINWDETHPENALYFRLRPVKKDSVFQIKDYYISGTLRKIAFSISLEEDIYHGELKRFDKEGKLAEIVNYQNGNKQGDYIQFDESGDTLAICTYSEDQPYEGIVYSEKFKLASKTTYKNGYIVKKLVYPADGQSKLKLITQLIQQGDDSVYQTKTYGYKGELLGTGTYTADNQIWSGVFSFIEPKTENLNLSYFTEGRQDSSLSFYKSGKLKSKALFLEKEKIISFSHENGKVLDSIQYKNEIPWVGTEYEFNGDIAFRKHSYKNGVLNGPFFDTYYLHGIKRSGQYKNGKLEGEIEYYDKDDNLICVGIYENDLRKEGDFVSRTDKYLIFTFKDGNLIQKRRHYPDRKKIAWVEYKDSIRVTYNQKGELIAKLIFKNNQKYTGKEYSYSANHLVTQIKEYKEGELVRNEFYNKEGNLKRSILYQNPKSRTETIYYPEGVKQSVSTIIFNNDRINKTVYFNKDGNTIGKLIREGYDKNGDEYFFEHGDIYKIDRYRNDTLIYKKRYAPNERLIYEIDYFGEANFYNQWGNILASATYKECKPYEGTVFEYQNRILKTITHMKEGMLHGKKTTFTQNSALNRRIIVKEENYKNGKREGFLKEFDRNGNPIQIIQYSNNKKDGKATFYGPTGIVTGTYEDGITYEGTFYEYSYGEISSIRTLKNGRPHGNWIKFNHHGDTSRIAIWENGFQKEQTNFLSGKAYKVSFKNNIKYDGVVPGYKKLLHHKNGYLIREEKYADENLERLLISIDYERPKNILTKTLYRTNGQKLSEIQFKAGKRNGEALYYEGKGKIIAKGIFQEDLPVEGSFIFYSKKTFDNYIKLKIEGHKVLAKAYQQGEESLSFKLTISDDLTQYDWQQNIASFLRNVESSCNYQYEIL
ncbi:hypothetical protein OO013_07705 [Mangrovivirga sp. M17]|uniref:Antitoxin component YwqK of YwqJK toxin-antitoxin module n=1 Tax=Mangrovivirga halotolerans TaxID=2993936 RepID=A0ABT3RPM1_9BACT|nr:hypothetical protein [Mangrovivirga halotolerans]MCX2743744.1 hypothetical protein [Mangrovivirga halotolerans]